MLWFLSGVWRTATEYRLHAPYPKSSRCARSAHHTLHRLNVRTMPARRHTNTHTTFSHSRIKRQNDRLPHQRTNTLTNTAHNVVNIIITNGDGHHHHRQLWTHPVDPFLDDSLPFIVLYYTARLLDNKKCAQFTVVNAQIRASNWPSWCTTGSCYYAAIKVGIFRTGNMLLLKII